MADPKSRSEFVEGLVQVMITVLTDLDVVTPVGAVGTTAARILKIAELLE
jgi:hypothetical protein